LLFFRAGKELVGGDLAIAVANMGSKNLTAGVLSLNLLEAGFATTTRAAVTDVFAEEALGWHTGAHAILFLWHCPIEHTCLFAKIGSAQTSIEKHVDNRGGGCLGLAGEFRVPRPINSHGVLLLRLSYSPQYSGDSYTSVGGSREL
jgi:hypothetical protein